MRLLTLRKILVATDFEDGSRAALTTARALAEAADAEIHVAHISNDQGATGSLAQLIDDVGLEAHRHVRSGDPAHAINVLSDEISADAILLGPHRKRAEAKGGTALGSTAMAVVTNAAVPCLVVTQALHIPLSRTVVAVDLSDSARGTLAVALTWTSALRGRDASSTTVLTALHVSQSALAANRKRELDQLFAEVRSEAGDWAGTTIESATEENANAADGIAEYAQANAADLVVLGTRGLGQERTGRLGSVAARLMLQVETPVLLVPPAVWTSTAGARATH